PGNPVDARFTQVAVNKYDFVSQLAVYGGDIRGAGRFMLAGKRRSDLNDARFVVNAGIFNVNGDFPKTLGINGFRLGGDDNRIFVREFMISKQSVQFTQFPRLLRPPPAPSR